MRKLFWIFAVLLLAAAAVADAIDRRTGRQPAAYGVDVSVSVAHPSEHGGFAAATGVLRPLLTGDFFRRGVRALAQLWSVLHKTWKSGNTGKKSK